jgi:hypothetical protein
LERSGTYAEKAFESAVIGMLSIIFAVKGKVGCVHIAIGKLGEASGISVDTMNPLAFLHVLDDTGKWLHRRIKVLTPAEIFAEIIFEEEESLRQLAL